MKAFLLAFLISVPAFAGKMVMVESFTFFCYDNDSPITYSAGESNYLFRRDVHHEISRRRFGELG